MTTTVRSVRVELEAGIAGYIRDMKLAGAETDRAFSGVEKRISASSQAVSRLERNTANLSKTSTEARVQQTQLGNGIDDTGRKASRAERSIDKYSGRLRALVDLAIIGSPALLRLGAGALPVVSAGLAGLGAAAGGIGVTALAISGMKDAFSALNDYELERTPENLQKVHLEMERLGPDAAEFVRHLNDLQPQLHSLQLLARAGVLPGWEEGIDDALTRLPLVRQIIASLSDEVGRLGADTGEAIASERLTPFLEYIRDSGAPTLDAFARSTGNVALGLANLLVAFDPASRDFTTGLENMTSRFAEWSEHLEHDEGFQSFLETVRDAGPELVELGGAAVDLFAGIVRAGAPLAKTTVPILTGLLKVLAAISDSPVGPAIYTAAAAWTVYSRAAKLAETATERIQTSWAGMSRGRVAAGVAGGLGLLATSLTDVDEKAGLANTTMLASAGLMVGGGWGLAIGAAIGAVVDLTSANDDLEQSFRDANDALASGDLDTAARKYDELRESIAKAEDQLQSVQFGGRHDGGFFSPLTDAWGALGTTLSGGLEGPKKNLEELGNDLRDARGDLDWFSLGAIGAAARVQELSGALAELQGWLDKRAAIREYRDNLRELAKGIKDGFGREDIENLDAFGSSIIQVANSIKDPALKQDFLNGAVTSLEKMADGAGPKAQTQIQRLTDQLHDLGLVDVQPPKLTVDSSEAEKKIAMNKLALREIHTMQARPHIGADDREAQQKGNAVKALMRQLAASKASPTVTMNTGNAMATLNALIARMNALDGRVVTTYTSVRPIGGQQPVHSADGGTVHGPRHPYGDKMLYAVAPGEEIVSNRFGQADRHRSLLKAINAGRYGADGRTVAAISTYTRRQNTPPGDEKNKATDVSHASQVFISATIAAAWELRGLKGAVSAAEKAVERSQKAYDKQKERVDAVNAAMDSLADSIASQFEVNLGAGGGFTVEDLMSQGLDFATASTIATDSQQTNTLNALNQSTAAAQAYPAVVAALQAAGLTGEALAKAMRELSPAQMAALAASPQVAGQYATAIAANAQAVGGAAGAGAQAVYGAEQRESNRLLHRLEKRLEDANEVAKAMNEKLEHLEQRSHEEPAETGAAVGKVIDKAARNGRL